MSFLKGSDGKDHKPNTHQTSISLLCEVPGTAPGISQSRGIPIKESCSYDNNNVKKNRSSLSCFTARKGGSGRSSISLFLRYVTGSLPLSCGYTYFYPSLPTYMSSLTLAPHTSCLPPPSPIRNERCQESFDKSPLTNCCERNMASTAAGC